VLLLHGGGQTRHSWAETARRLADAGWRAIALDLRGHGESAWDPDGDYHFDRFADDIVAVAASLGARPALVGASLGGIAALIAQARTPGTLASALVLVDIAPKIEPDGADRIVNFMTARPDGFASLEEVADAIAEYNPHRPRPRDLSGLEKNLRLGDDGRYRWHWDPRFLAADRPSRTEDSTLEDAARTLDLPTLLVRGRLSDLLSEQGARHFLELVPHAEFADVSGAGHMVAGDRNDAFTRAVVGFLERVA
jgi:pimeloyl-ACP methyl ester carboxylesterase